ncbi:MAG TPA: hypothetical protein VFS00_10985, partial [Polyangiaceae bacterium]|nr:hypothetical protein [Polyangiaceae bacterium]
CALAAFAFGRGDYMRRAWGFMGGCSALLLLDALLFGSNPHGVRRAVSPLVAGASGTLTAFANLSVVVGMVLVARAWRVAGLELRFSRGAWLGASAASSALALAIAGASAWRDTLAVLGGQLDAISSLASDLGDIASLAVLSPVLLTTLTLRGGSLAWPWGALALSTTGWLLFDGLAASGQLFDVHLPMEHAVQEALRVFACASTLAAGLLQRAALSGSGRG